MVSVKECLEYYNKGKASPSICRPIFGDARKNAIDGINLVQRAFGDNHPEMTMLVNDILKFIDNIIKLFAEAPSYNKEDAEEKINIAIGTAEDAKKRYKQASKYVDTHVPRPKKGGFRKRTQRKRRTQRSHRK